MKSLFSFRQAFESFFLSISEIFFVKQWRSGFALWLVLLLLYPVQSSIATVGLLISLFLHLLFRVTVSQQLKQWLGLNALLVGFGYAYSFGFTLHPSYFAWLFAVLFVHQVLFYILIGIVSQRLQLPLLTLSFIIILKAMVPALPQQVHQTAVDDWANLGPTLNAYLSPHVPESISVFFRSLGVLLFLNDIALGAVIALVIVVYSRILFSLAVISYVLLLLLRGLLPSLVSFDLVVFNCLITVMMIGAVWEIPSRWSYRHAALFGVLSVLISIFIFTKFPPTLNLPFVLSVYAYVLAKPHMSTEGALPFDFTPGTPEQNLYYAQNRRERYAAVALPSFELPFNGEWKVTQAHDGELTHKREWRHAWDFERVDEAGHVSKGNGQLLSEFYTYRQPVCAAMEGHVVNLQAFVPDNDIGNFNFGQNWGNTVVLQHPNGQCSAYSHLSLIANTLFMGKWVNKGEVLGYCGNSGRSDKPHLHFQFQSSAKIGDNTLPVPFKKYLVRDRGLSLKIRDYPKNGERVSNLIHSPRLADAFTYPFGKELSAAGELDGTPTTERWISAVDFYNHTYLYCYETGGAAYFFSEDGVFYFADYFGPKDTLLNHFALAASRIVFSEQQGLRYLDQLPLNRVKAAPSNLLVDMITPFQNVKEVQCGFDVTQQHDRTIIIKSTLVTVYTLLPHRSHTLALSELSFPYGARSIRLKTTKKKSTITCTITY